MIRMTHRKFYGTKQKLAFMPWHQRRNMCNICRCRQSMQFRSNANFIHGIPTGPEGKRIGSKWIEMHRMGGTDWMCNTRTFQISFSGPYLLLYPFIVQLKIWVSNQLYLPFECILFHSFSIAVIFHWNWFQSANLHVHVWIKFDWLLFPRTKFNLLSFVSIGMFPRTK